MLYIYDIYIYIRHIYIHIFECGAFDSKALGLDSKEILSPVSAWLTFNGCNPSLGISSRDFYRH